MLHASRKAYINLSQLLRLSQLRHPKDGINLNSSVNPLEIGAIQYLAIVRGGIIKVHEFS